MGRHVIAVVDYGVGNLKSVTNAFDYLGLDSIISQEKEIMQKADAILLPGVGAFPDAAQKLKPLVDFLVEESRHKPILGICLGMQLLFTQGMEGRPTQGLNLIEGQVERIVTGEKLPHIGWNRLTYPNPSPLFFGVETGSYVYFVHSFCALPTHAEDVLAVTDYGTTVTAAVGRGNVYGCQFHPEKSGENGLQILKNFGEMNR